MPRKSNAAHWLPTTIGIRPWWLRVPHQSRFPALRMTSAALSLSEPNVNTRYISEAFCGSVTCGAKSARAFILPSENENMDISLAHCPHEKYPPSAATSIRSSLLLSKEAFFTLPYSISKASLERLRAACLPNGGLSAAEGAVAGVAGGSSLSFSL